jgi:hypothetical protein
MEGARDLVPIEIKSAQTIAADFFPASTTGVSSVESWEVQVPSSTAETEASAGSPWWFTAGARSELKKHLTERSSSRPR